MKKIVLFSIWTIVIFGLIFYLIRHLHDLKNIIAVSIQDIIALSLLFFMTQYLNAVRLRLMIKKIGLSLDVKEAFHLSNMNTMANYLPFKGGAVATAVYFRNRHDVPYISFINLSAANQIFQLIVISFVSFSAIILGYFISGIFYSKLFYFFWALFILMLIAVVIIGFLVRKEKFFGIRLKKIGDMVVEADRVFNDRSILSRMFFINVLIMFFMGLRFSVAFGALSYNAPLLVSLLAGQAKTLATLINITPSGLGLAEVSAGLISSLMKGNINIGIYAASIDRIISILSLIVICGISGAFFYNKKDSSADKKAEVADA